MRPEDCHDYACWVSNDDAITPRTDTGPDADAADPPACRHLVVMGVAGSGKTTIAQQVAALLRAASAEADDFHSPEHRDQMAAGVPLTSEQRQPWLGRIRDWIEQQDAHGLHTVVTCSALKRQYRDFLRASGLTLEFVHLHASEESLRRRLHLRHGHFMPASMLTSQLATLEPLAPDEPGIVIDASAAVSEVVAAVYEFIGHSSAEDDCAQAQ